MNMSKHVKGPFEFTNTFSANPLKISNLIVAR